MLKISWPRLLVYLIMFVPTASVFAQSNFDQTVSAAGGASAFDIILVQDCSVLNSGSGNNLDQGYNAKLCSA